MFTLLAAASALASAAPVPKPLKKKTDYFPTAVGTKWEYVKEGTSTLDHTREVTQSDDADGIRTAVFKWTSHSGNYGPITHYRVDSKGIYRLGFGKTEPFKVPFLLFKTESQPGDAWDAGVSTQGDAPTHLGERGKDEEVETPAGKFSTAVVTVRHKKQEWVYWYADSVGLVKFSNEDGKAIVLSKFTPGR
jgi:hypothetical protein